MTSLDTLHTVLVEMGNIELACYAEAALEQRSRLLTGINSLSAENNILQNRLLSLKERYRLLEAKHSQLVGINREHLEALRLARKELGKS